MNRGGWCRLCRRCRCDSRDAWYDALDSPGAGLCAQYAPVECQVITRDDFDCLRSLDVAEDVASHVD
jgi:hypothetical protein